ncbi:hypothetical protein CCR80_00455 [Rhodothalassium salexigens]|uniref:rod-binding protein n=1 Tax=Rhodothalassium salexigens TaxID=1086 RepID=UPI0019112D36|nr:rod-binding protein [Rhodothalassium salexigens]MBK5919510.1 hypothetical protein [Rhodothalassium salexigens]
MTDALSHMNASLDLARIQKGQSAAEDITRRFQPGANVDVDKAATKFESMFLAQMLAPMMDTIPTDGPFGGGPGGEMFRSMLTEELGKEMAKSGGIGIADMIRQELLALQER